MRSVAVGAMPPCGEASAIDFLGTGSAGLPAASYRTATSFIPIRTSGFMRHVFDPESHCPNEAAHLARSNPSCRQFGRLALQRLDNIVAVWGVMANATQTHLVQRDRFWVRMRAEPGLRLQTEVASNPLR